MGWDSGKPSRSAVDLSGLAAERKESVSGFAQHCRATPPSEPGVFGERAAGLVYLMDRLHWADSP